jgi:WD40 repeat protein
MDNVEITLQYARNGTWPVVAEHRRRGGLPARAEGQLLPTAGISDRDAFETALIQLQDQHRAYGTLLGQALFRGAIRDRFRAARGAASSDGLRILLVVEAPDLRPLRWERLCAPSGPEGWDFLALDQTTPYSRYLPSLSDRHFPTIGRRDLRALVVLADPPAGNAYRLAPFDAAGTAKAVAGALGAIPHDLLGPVPGAVGPASLDTLAECITAGGYTLLHLVAHGAVRARDGETLLYLLDDAGQVAPVTATELIRRLARIKANRGLPHLAFLATCKGAKPEAETALGGLAQRLVRDLGLPAVVAMTDRVSIDTAADLATTFYVRLRERGEPDLALVEAGAGLQGRSDILVPALFGRLADRPLFSTHIDDDRPLTPAELDHGLERLGPLIDERAPVLLDDIKGYAKALRATLPTDWIALHEPARKERQTAVDALDALTQEVLDLGFPALALDEPAPDWDLRCPFPGLKAFQTDERAFFFGREALVRQLAERLRRDCFLAVLGPSGSGKSSLVLAGLVPALLGDAVSQPAPDGPYRYLTPGADPQAALARQLATAPPTDADTLLVVDQLEELFTLCTDSTRREAFVADLAAIRDARPHLHLVLTLRADFWGDCASHPALKRPMQAHQELIAPLDTAELRTAMEQQAGTTGLRFEADLSHNILAEVRGEPGTMPLLQHLLLQLWLRRHGRWLRASEYRALGGIREAISHTADGICEQLIDEKVADEPLLRAIFIRLTRLDEQGAAPGSEAAAHVHGENLEGYRDTRQRIALAELVSIDAEPQRVRRIVQRLADARVLVTTPSGSGDQARSDSDDTQVEVSHEALIRYWPRLRDWIGDDREAWRLLKDVGKDASQWNEAGEHDKDLPRWGERMQHAEALFEQPRFRPTDTERRFVAAARALDERERKDKEDRETARIAALEIATDQERRKKRNAWIGTSVAMLLLAVAVWFGIESNRAREEATAQGRSAQRQLALTHWKQAVVTRENEPLKAAHWFALAAQRFDQAKLPQRRNNALLAFKLINDQPLLHAVLPHKKRLRGAEYSADGGRILTWSDDGSARLWEAATGKPLVPPMTHKKGVDGAQFSPDGSRILTWSDSDATARVWDADTGQAVIPPLAHDDEVWGAQFNADGSRVLTWGFDGTARLWDAATGHPVTPPLTHEGLVQDAQFNADESLILTWSDDGTARLWDANTGKPIIPPLAHKAQVSGARFNADESRILTWSADGTARLWDAATGQAITPPLSHEIEIVSQLPEPGGDLSRLQWFMASGLIGARFDAATGRPISPTLASNTEYMFFSIEDDGPRISDEGTAKIPSPTVPQEVKSEGSSAEPESNQSFLDFLKDAGFKCVGCDAGAGQPIASATADNGEISGTHSNTDKSPILIWGEDGRPRLSDTATGKVLSPPLVVEGRVLGARLNGDESRILTWAKDGTARLWDAVTGNAITAPLRHKGDVWGARFNGDESRILTWSEDGTARLWDAATGQALTPPLAHERGSLHGAIFSSDESRILTWGEDYTARLWDGVDGQPLHTMVHQGPVWGAQFNADESRILTWSVDGTARLWDTATGQPISVPLAHEDTVRGARFNADESHILTWGDDGTARLWDVRTDGNIKTVAAQLRRRSYEGARFSSDGSRILSFDDGTVRLWDTATGKPVTPPLAGEGKISGAFLNSDASRIVTWTGDGNVLLWDGTTGLPMTPPMAHGSFVEGAKFYGDASRILSWGGDNAARLWDAATGNAVVPPLEHEKRVLGAELSGDGARVLTWSEDGTARLWNAATGDAVTPPLVHEERVYGGELTADVTRVLTWSDGTARVWDIATGKTITAPMKYGPGNIRGGARFNRDGSRILTWGPSVGLWDATSGEAVVPPMTGEEGATGGAYFSADEARILAYGTAARVWDAATGKAITPPMAQAGNLRGAQFSADDSRIITWTSSSTAHLWDAATGVLLGSPLAFDPYSWGPGKINDRGDSVLLWIPKRGLLTWDVSVDNAWPIQKTALKVEAETGTTLTETGELEFLSAEDWLRTRCEYDRIRRDLTLHDGKARITDTEWAIARQRCPDAGYQTAEGSVSGFTQVASTPNAN